MATSYANTGGTGDRTALITVTSDASSFAGVPENLVNGLTGNLAIWSWLWNGGQTLRTVTFDFTTIGHVLIDEAFWKTDGGENNGQWDWYGSDNGSSWTLLTPSNFLLQGSHGGNVIGNLSGNTTAYYYYQLRQVSGTTSTFSFLYEIEFKIDTLPTSVTGTLAATEGPDVVAIVSNIPATGTLAATESPDVVSIHGVDARSGTLATTEAPDKVDFTSGPIDIQALAATEAPDTVAIVGAIRSHPYPVVFVSGG